MNRLSLIYTLPAISILAAVGIYCSMVLIFVGALMVWGAGGVDEE